MRKFLIKLVLFVLPILLIAYPIDVLISKNLYRTGSEFGDLPEIKRVHDGNINADILVVGSSRAEVHFNTNILEQELGLSAFNLGIGGGDWNLIRHRIDKYLENNTPPKYLIANIDVGMFKQSNAKYQIRTALLPYLLFDFHTYRVYDVPLEDVIFPLVRYIGQRKIIASALQLWLNDDFSPTTKVNGFLAVDEPFNDQPLDAFRKSDFSTLDIAPESLYHYLENNFPETIIIGVHTPLLLDSLMMMNLEHIRSSQFLEAFEKHNWAFLDYSESTISKDKRNFYNSLHLNARGAKNFTLLLVDDLRKIGVF